MNRTFYALLCAVFLVACGKEEKVLPEKDVWRVTCDAEKTKGDKLMGTDDAQFSGVSARSKHMARSGKYSIKLSEKNAYGFNYVIRNVKKGTVIDASVWKNVDAKHGALVVTSFKDDQNYGSSGHIKEEEGKWGKMKLMYVAPENFDSLAVYVYNLDKEPVYFDDLEINVYTKTSKPKVGPKDRSLRIDIPTSAMDSLENFRKIALEQEIITGDLKAYVRAFVHVDGQKVPVELRLKGDWTDHVETDKVSYRIKMGDDASFDGLRTFSIQNPETRSFMMEWFAHQLFEYEDLLTTRYEMIPVVINGKNMGVYALEEHFDKQLLEARHRREGPIMKFDESGVWQVHKNAALAKVYVNAPAFESAEISVFKKNRTKKTPSLLAQFTVGQSNLEKLRSGDNNVGDYMDVESTAKFLALVDLINGKHGLTWHNNRYYMNPITQRMEIIGYDCFMEQNALIRKHKLLGLMDPRDEEYSVLRRTLEDEQVHSRYVYYLEQFSRPEYLKKVYASLGKKIDQVEALLHHEYPNLSLDKSFFEFNRKSIAKQLPQLKKLEKIQLISYDPVYEKLPENFIYTDIALKANVEQRNADSSVVMSLRNFHSYPLEIIGYSTKENKDLIIPMAPIQLSACNAGKATVKEARFPVKPRRIHYRAANCGEKVFKCNPEEWAMAVAKPTVQKAMMVMAPDATGTVRLRGKLAFSQDVIIPACKVLLIEAGTKINLSNNAAIVSYAPVKAEGTAEDRIVIYSLDHSSNGFVVLSNEKSTLRYMDFDHLSTMNKNNWGLTGAVTFYNAEVDLDHCTFTNNHCEDALNTVRCKVSVTNCEVNTTLSDGFDADFCTGTVSNSRFLNTGNDCIDFSGSNITISDCYISHSGDKGISGGEDSHLVVKGCTIDGANIAVASKDKSSVTISDITILKANYAFSAYRKKPEYGPATLKVESIKKNNATHLHLLEKDSRLDYMGKEYVGTEKFDIDAMYAEFSK